MEKEFSKQFKACPNCGYEDRFLEQLGNETKEKGWARDEWNFHLDAKNGVAIDQVKVPSIPIGAEVPGFSFTTDICMNCGCLYAVEIKRMDAKKSVSQTPPLPNRQQRRQGGSGLVNPFGEN